jgi:hypothetical protein
MNILNQQEDYNSEEYQRHEEEMENAVDDAWYMCQRIEKGLIKLMRESNGNIAPSPDRVEGSTKVSEKDYELLKRGYRKLKKEFDEREKELNTLKGKSVR